MKDLSSLLQYAGDFNHICVTYYVNALKNINELKFNLWSYINIYANENEESLMQLYIILTFLA